ncbi:fibronectin type III domain-containing protein [Moritella viscosa]|uniref:fibronectin type III domain-containing protein n=1 Tax=Moritella viscosa TaxID=80854 RepID=UPI0009198DB1|nr:PA14 domain-containing protein [Moritella viscosa]SGZ03192.1 Putative uncharacterized protein [Moritella viscosa]
MKYIFWIVLILSVSGCNEGAGAQQSIPLPRPEPEQPEKEVMAVENVRLIETSQTSLTLGWDDSHNANGYIIRRDGNKVATVSRGLYRFVDINLQENRSYVYDVLALDKEGRESESRTITALTMANDSPVISPITDIVLLNDTATVGAFVAKINASDANGDALHYQVSSEQALNYFTIDEDGALTVIASVNKLSLKVMDISVDVSDGLSSVTVLLHVAFIPNAEKPENQGLLRKYYQDNRVKGKLSELKALPTFPDNPTSINIETDFESPSNIGSRYGQTLEGYIVPPVTGDYQFWIASDDESELLLSDSVSTKGLRRIAYTERATNKREWDPVRYGSQASEIIYLEAGQVYAVKALMAEGYGSDLLAVAWEGPEIPRGVITNQYLRLPVDTIKPKPIFNFNWLKTSEDTVILQWNATTDNVDVKRYLISESNKLLATTSKDKLSIELTGLESATRYDFTIRAQDKAGNKSMESDPLMIVIDDFIAPSVVTNIRVNEKGTNFIDLGWDASTDEDKQQILYRIYQDGELAAQTYNTNYRLKQLLPATNYNLTLEAVDIVGNSSGLSNGLSMQTNALVADTPVFEYPYYEFSVPANGSIGSSFATLSFNEQQGLAFKVVGGDDADLFGINEKGQLSLKRHVLEGELHSFDLEITINKDNKTSSTLVKVHVLPSDVLLYQGVSQEVWTGISGSSVAVINTLAPINQQSTLTNFKSLTNMGSSYGQRVYGYFTVPVSGVYNFWIASDDHSELRISSDMTRDKADLVAHITGYTSEDNWRDSSQVKTNINLNAGQYYYIEVLHKEGGGGDHMSVAWQGAGIPNRTLMTGEFLIPYNRFHPAAVNVDTAIQTGFDSQGNQIKLNLSVDKSAEGYPVWIYYGEMDAGSNTEGWQYRVKLNDLLAGEHDITLSPIDPGKTYYIRTETVGPTGSRWSSNVTIVRTVIIDKNKTAGESLPQNIDIDVSINDVDYALEFTKHSVRSPNFQLLTFDSRRVKEYESVSPMPEIRTYRGIVTNNSTVTVTGVIDALGSIHISAWKGDMLFWQKKVDVSGFITTTALGNDETDTQELIIDFELPAIENGRLYQPQPGNDFHNSLARVAFKFEENQFDKGAGNNIINGVAQMEGHINELDYMWAQKTGLRWDMGKAVIELKDDIGKATQTRPSAPDATNFSIDFQDPVNGGQCWGGGYWVGCTAGYTMSWGFTHEIGHNLGLGHGEQTDNNNQIQEPRTHMGNMQAWNTTRRIQKGSRFKAAKALTDPMLPATFKDYLTVYKNESGLVNPLANDYDANGDLLTIESFDATTLAGGTVIVYGDSLRYTPPADFVGVDQFSYIATDGEYKTRGPVMIQVVTPELVADWNMDNLKDNKVTDSSVFGHDLQAETTGVKLIEMQTAGRTDQGITIPLLAAKEMVNDPLGDSLLPHKLDPGHKSFTAAMWFKYSVTDGDKLLIGKSSKTPNNMNYGGWEIRASGHDLEIQVNFRDRFMYPNNVTITQPAAIVDGSWHHVAVVIDRENQLLLGYIDGAPFDLQGDLPMGNSPIIAAMNTSGYGGGSPFKVGGHTSVTCEDGATSADPKVCVSALEQAYDSVKIYHKALSAAEVSALLTE